MNKKMTNEEFFSLFLSLLISRNKLVIELDFFIPFLEECKENNKYLNFIDLNGDSVPNYIEKIEKILTKLKEDNIYTYFSSVDNMVYIYDNIDYKSIIYKYFDYFEEVSEFINDYFEYSINLYYGDEINEYADANIRLLS